MAHPRQRIPGDRRGRAGVAARLSPLVVFFLLTVGVGLAHGALQSLGLAGPPALDPGRRGMGLFYGYRELFMEPELVASLGHSIAVAFVSAAVSVALGAVGAYVLWRAPPRVRAVANVYRLPIILPHIVVAFITLVIWAPTGVVAAALAGIGLDFGAPGFPQLVFAPNGVGMVLAYIYKSAPFVMLMAVGVLDRTPERLVVTARMLGAGPLRVFRSVILPLLAPILNQMFIILFLYALGGFDIPRLLGASSPQMLSMTVYDLYFHGTLADRSTAMAALTLLSLAAGGFVVVYSRIARRLAVWERPV